jgi:hypothetical protein
MAEVLWNILTKSQTALRTFVWEIKGTDSTKAITDDHIVIRKSHRQKQFEAGFVNEATPGVIITPSLKINIDPQAGENARDYIQYPVLFQVIDSDLGDRGDEENLRTWLHWQEKIGRFFRNQQPLSIAELYLVTVNVVDTVDETLFVRAERFVGGIVVTFWSCEVRGGVTVE